MLPMQSEKSEKSLLSPREVESATPLLGAQPEPKRMRRCLWPLLALLITALGLSFAAVRLFLPDVWALHSVTVAQFLPECTTEQYNSGSWQLVRQKRSSFESRQEVLKSMGYSTCKAQSRGDWDFHGGRAETADWHLEARVPQQIAFTWQAPWKTCRMPETSDVDKLQMLLDKPLLLVGDDSAHQQFVQMSCELGQHVEWMMDKHLIKNSTSLEPWQYLIQDLYLDPASPLASRLSGDIDRPLISYMPLHLPLMSDESGKLPSSVNTSLIAEYLETQKDWPDLVRSVDDVVGTMEQYGVLLLSAGALVHREQVPYPIENQSNLALAYEVAIETRSSVHRLFTALKQSLRLDQRVLVRSNTRGHHACHEAKGPLKEEDASAFDVRPPYALWPFYNKMLKESAHQAGFEWLDTSRISALRPDAHLPDDCRHIMLGSGVFEAYSKHLWTLLRRPKA